MPGSCEDVDAIATAVGLPSSEYPVNTYIAMYPHEPADVVAGRAADGVQRVADSTLQPAAIHAVVALGVADGQGGLRALDDQYVFTGYADDGRPTAVAIASTTSQLPGIAAESQPVGTAVGVPRRGNKLGGVVLAMKAYMALCMKSHRSTPWRRQVS